MPSILNTVEKFWSLVEPIPFSGCWIWNGGLGGDGYGRFCFNGKRWKTHRLALFLSGVKIPDDRFACHYCDVRECVNPSHIFFGTMSDNIKDMWKKGRQRLNPRIGEKHGMAILTEKQVLDIRSKYSGKRGDLTNLGEEYGVDYSTISLIIKRKHWKHI